MRVGIATVWTPLLRGGAEFLAAGLAEVVARAGHQVYRITSRLEWGSADARASAALLHGLDLNAFGGDGIDRLVCLKLPSWYARHPNGVGWLLHQHRPAYDLFGTASGLADDAEGRALASATATEDGVALRRLRGVYTIFARVSERLSALLALASTPLCHPPLHAEREDYNHVTFEAMLAARAVVTCTDSGGPLEFVYDGEAGFVVEPEPKAVARLLDRLVRDEALAARLGRAGRAHYDTLDIGWQPVVEGLFACAPVTADIGAGAAP